MSTQSISLRRIVRKSSAAFFGRAFVVSAGVLLAGSIVSAQAQAPDYTTFRSVLKASGTLSPDESTITFALFRQDLSALTISLNGATTVPAAPESVANGYVAVKRIGDEGNKYFFTGAFPALASELPALEAVLEARSLPITAIVNATAGLSKPVVTVHIEGTMKGSANELATSFLAALDTIKSPQLKVTVVQINSPVPSVPARFAALVGDGYFTVLDDNVLMFSLPRTDAVPLTLGEVPATPSLGVGQSVFISGKGKVLLNTELALKAHEVQKVSEILVLAGFTVSAQSGYFVDDSKRITFLHAAATSTDVDTFYAQAEQLGKVLNMIK